MFVCLAKTFNGIRSKVYGCTVFPNNKDFFVIIQNVLSNRANFLEKNDTCVNFLESITSAPM